MIGYLSGRTDKLDMKPTPIVILQSDHINILTLYPNNTTILAEIQYNFSCTDSQSPISHFNKREL